MHLFKLTRATLDRAPHGLVLLPDRVLMHFLQLVDKFRSGRVHISWYLRLLYSTVNVVHFTALASVICGRKGAST